MLNDESKWRVLTILKINREKNPNQWFTSRELSFYTGISKTSLRAIISRWFRYKWPYIQRQQLDFNCWGYYIGSRGLTFLTSAPRFLDVAKFESRLVEYQMSVGLIERPVKQIIPVEAIEQETDAIKESKYVCQGCNAEFSENILDDDGYCPDCLKVLAIPEPLKPDRYGVYHCKECGRPCYLEGIDKSTGLCLQCKINY